MRCSSASVLKRQVVGRRRTLDDEDEPAPVSVRSAKALAKTRAVRIDGLPRLRKFRLQSVDLSPNQTLG